MVSHGSEGATIWDTELHESIFKYRVGQTKLNAILCDKTLTDSQIDAFKESIEENYQYRLYTDNLPSATKMRHQNTGGFGCD